MSDYTSRTMTIIMFLTVANLVAVGLCWAEQNQTILSREQEPALMDNLLILAEGHADQ